MKKISLILLTILAFTVTTVLAQSPQSFKYQAVARNSTGDILANQNISIKINIHEGSAAGPVVYEEEFVSILTNGFGLVNLGIGTGSWISGNFALIDWGSNSHFIEIEMDENGGTAYSVMGTAQLLSVPYSLYSEKTGNVDDADADPTNEYNTSVILNSTNLEITDGGGTIIADLNSLINDSDPDPTNELQALSISNDTIYLSNGGFVVFPYDPFPLTSDDPSFACGDKFLDWRDGKTYSTVLIGSQCWMKENMRTTKYPDGSPITKGAVTHGDASWGTDQAWYSCPPNSTNDGEDCAAAASLGMLYQWSAAMDGSITLGAQGICPCGWHVPTDAEWKTLEGSLGMIAAEQDATDWRGTNEGSKMADHVADQNWSTNNLTGDAGFGLSGLVVAPSGFRYTNGLYNTRGNTTHLWSSTGVVPSAWRRYWHSTSTQVDRNIFSKAYGFSVRCIKD